MASGQQPANQSLDDFLRPLHITDSTIFHLSRALWERFRWLTDRSENQFLPTPISESLLRRVNDADRGRYLAIDIGGTNLRVGFVELLAGAFKGQLEGLSSLSYKPPRLRRLLERSWPIGEQLKDQNPDHLFEFIGECISCVVRDACEEWGLSRTTELPMGVTFSFPMEQKSLREATLMPMGKGFALDCKVDLGACLIAGYEEYRRKNLPPIRVAAIANDAVASLVSFIYQFQAKANQKAVMALICGTGTNATIPLKRCYLKDSKLPKKVSVISGQEDGGDDDDNVKIAVNTEWSINGTKACLGKFGIITRWDTELNRNVERPDFQPLEYMTAGRYLGELGRIIFQDYLIKVLGYDFSALPRKFKEPFSLSTTFLSHYKPRDGDYGALVEQLQKEFPIVDRENQEPRFHEQLLWTPEMAEALYRIAISIEVRAAGLMAAYTIGLLLLSEDLLSPYGPEPTADTRTELVVGYTGGCITAFQNYLDDCQAFLDRVVRLGWGGDTRFRVLLSECHNGGITGAGILVPASLNSEEK